MWWADEGGVMQLKSCVVFFLRPSMTVGVQPVRWLHLIVSQANADGDPAA